MVWYLTKIDTETVMTKLITLGRASNETKTLKFPDPNQVEQDDGLSTIYQGVVVPCSAFNTGIAQQDCE